MEPIIINREELPQMTKDQMVAAIIRLEDVYHPLVKEYAKVKKQFEEALASNVAIAGSLLELKNQNAAITKDFAAYKRQYPEPPK